MKKILFSLVLSVMAICVSNAQEVTIKAGTIVPLQAVNAVKAADVDEGQKVSFRVSRDINVDGVTAIPYGTLVSGKVYEAKKSSWWGTRGRLGIKIDEIQMPTGEIVPLQNGDIYIKGKNRTALSVVLFCVVTMPACFICGSKAEMPNGYEIHANVAANTTINVK